jgi:hypothetical protein
MKRNREPEFVSVNEAEATYGISRWTWRQYAYKGDIESIKVGRRLLIPLSEIQRVFSDGRRPRRKPSAGEVE